MHILTQSELKKLHKQLFGTTEIVKFGGAIWTGTEYLIEIVGTFYTSNGVNLEPVRK